MGNTTKAISAVTILLVISRIFGFIREMVIAAYYGATYQTDAYNMAVLIMGLSTAIISAAVATVIVPMYNHKRIQKSKSDADLFASNILCITSLFYVFLSVAGIIFAPVLVRLFAPNFDITTAALTVNITRMIFIFTIAVNISNLISFIAQIYDKFAVTVIASFPFSIFTVVSTVFFADKIGIYALVIAYILFLLTQALLLILSVRKTFKFKFAVNFTNSDLKDTLKLSLPIFLSVALWEVNIIIDKILASGLAEGSVSLMMYASRLRSLPDGIITASVITVMFPLLSKYAAQKEFAYLKVTVTKAVSLLFMALLPVTAVSIYYAKDITAIVYERGVFTPENTALTATVFTFAVLSLAFTGVAGLLSNLFYSVQNTKTPQIAAGIMLAVNVMFNLILVRYMQTAGLALATSIASFVYFSLLLIQFRRKFGAFNGIVLLKNISKYAAAVSGMIPVFLICEVLRGTLPTLAFFTVAAVFSLCVYIWLLYLFKADLFMEIWTHIENSVKIKLKRKRVL